MTLDMANFLSFHQIFGQELMRHLMQPEACMRSICRDQEQKVLASLIDNSFLLLQKCPSWPTAKSSILILLLFDKWQNEMDMLK